jgi:hypothetical protein
MAQPSKEILELYEELEAATATLANLRRNPGSMLVELKLLEDEITSINKSIQEELKKED